MQTSIKRYIRCFQQDKERALVGGLLRRGGGCETSYCHGYKRGVLAPVLSSGMRCRLQDPGIMNIF